MLFSFASPSAPNPQRDPRSGDADQPLTDRDEVREEIRATLATLMPWGVSILVHLSLIVLAFFLVWQTIVNGPESEPTSPTLARTPNAIAPSNQTQTEPESSSASSMRITPVVTPPTEVKPVLPGFKLPSVHVPVPHNPGPSLGLTGQSVGKKSGPFGVGDGDKDGDGEPGGGSNRVVFVVDASGSMVDVLPFVVNELKRVVNTELDKEFEATVLFFSGSGVFEMPGGKGLRSVDAGFKARFQDWATLANHHYDTGGRGSTHVRQALTRALRYEPGVVYLLSDNLTGGGQGATQHELFQDELIDLIHDQNDFDSPARISTVQFLYEDPLVRAGLMGTLQRIAEETGGAYKFMGERDLKLR